MAKTQTTKAGLQLRLYVAGNAPNSATAIANARAICAEHFSGGHEIEVVDLLEYPLRALADGVVVTPTLLRLSPLPVRKVVGNLSDAKQVLSALASK
jgi:circadian clock protein KaiB